VGSGIQVDPLSWYLPQVYPPIAALWKRLTEGRSKNTAINSRDPSMLIRIDGPPTRDAFLRAFWLWVEILANGDTARASAALHWDQSPRDPHALSSQIQRFWGGDRSWHVVVPNDRLVRQVSEAAQFSLLNSRRSDGRIAWGLAQVPVTTEPERAKEDDVPVMGVAVSFFLKGVPGGLALEFEIIHV
jgi:hypothetical protein